MRDFKGSTRAHKSERTTDDTNLPIAINLSVAWNSAGREWSHATSGDCGYRAKCKVLREL
jgi:hypothetical protein